MSHLQGLRTPNLDEIENKKVFVRLDLDVPGAEKDHPLLKLKVRQAAASLLPFMKKGAKVIAAASLGRFDADKGQKKKKRSIVDIGAMLSAELRMDVVVPDECAGEATKRVVAMLRDDQVCLLENLELEGESGSGREAFALELQKYCDIYVSDSLSDAAVAGATTVDLPRLMPETFVTPALIDELRAISKIQNCLAPPLVVIWGGQSIHEHLELMRQLEPSATQIFVGAQVANTLCAARGDSMGKSQFAEDELAAGRTILQAWGSKIVLPEDFRVAEGPRKGESLVSSRGKVSDTMMALDLGPAATNTMKAAVLAAGSVIWVGGLGLYRVDAFAQSSRQLSAALCESSAFTLVAGGDSVAAFETLRPAPPTAESPAEPTDAESASGSETEEPEGMLSMTPFVSRSGKAALSLLKNEKLTGLEALRGLES